MPPKDIPAVFDKLKINMPVEACGIIKWFENYYVHGRVRYTLRNRNVVRSIPLFSLLLWSVTDNVKYTFS